MEAKDKMEGILKRMKVMEQHSRAEFASLKKAMEEWMPEVEKKMEGLQISVVALQAKVNQAPHPSPPLFPNDPQYQGDTARMGNGTSMLGLTPYPAPPRSIVQPQRQPHHHECSGGDA
ncbi:hypothetical protein E2562_032567 [Oryza meyeriana var. granulata]|uniref:FRIGIDA-like protein n=1 Tax=Oryza meyeriana var. granulata TaxID=110450 RepID=A0A6G1CVR7_9ORYZ|nr:hypothetical protein E2562_032567 [Oryza meyeriana var. granulata]